MAENHTLTAEQALQIRALLEAARPFTSSDVVDETEGTLSLMRELEHCIRDAELMLNG